MRLKATVSYDGSGYAGWQRQDNARGIESIIMDVMERIHHHPVEITGSGRTDAGVHAIAQVFHFDSELKMTPFFLRTSACRMSKKYGKISMPALTQ